MTQWLDLLKELCATPGVAGFEEEVGRIVLSRLRGVVDRVEKDQMGNVYGVRKGARDDGPVLMITAHMDEVGLIVKHVEETGFLRVQRLGGVPENVLLGQRVSLWGSKGPLAGLIGQKPAHIMSDSERRTVPNVGDLYVDIGAHSRKEVNEFGVEAGTPITYDREIRQVGREFVTGKAIDNRVGVTVMLEAAEELSKRELESTIYCVGTVQEEVGFRGARVATARIEPDIALVLDGLHAGGTPDVTERELPMRLGCGPAITIAGSSQSGGFIANKKLREHIVRIAEAEGIPFQYNVGVGAGVSDSAMVHLTGKGVATSDILVIRRYSHSPIEMASLRDIENAIRLVTAVVPQLDRRFLAGLKE
jgi:endoglucanase